MRKIRAALRLWLEVGLSVRQISAGSIQELLKSAQTLALAWPQPAELEDARLAALFYPQASS